MTGDRTSIQWAVRFDYADGRPKSRIKRYPDEFTANTVAATMRCDGVETTVLHRLVVKTGWRHTPFLSIETPPARGEDRRGQYIAGAGGIGAGAEGRQILTWGGPVSIADAGPSRTSADHVFLTLGIPALDRYASPETCPMVHVTVSDECARDLANGILRVLADKSAGEATA